MDYDNYKSLARLGPEDAFRLAIHKSKLPHSEICKAMNWSESFLRRVLSVEKYFPSFEDIPNFCKVIENDIPIRWLKAKYLQSFVHEKKVATCESLKDSTLYLGKETGDIFAVIQESIADRHLDLNEIRTIIKEGHDVSSLIACLISSLRGAEKEALKAGA